MIPLNSDGRMNKGSAYRREIAAYVTFAVSAAACGGFAGGALLRRNTESMSYFVFFGLCATVLPFLVRGPRGSTARPVGDAE